MRTIRILIRHIDYGGASYGADMPALVSYATVEVNDEALSNLLVVHPDARTHAEIIGFEVLAKAEERSGR